MINENMKKRIKSYKIIHNNQANGTGKSTQEKQFHCRVRRIRLKERKKERKTRKRIFLQLHDNP